MKLPGILLAPILNNIRERSHIIRYIEAFREHGYKKANLDPLKLEEIGYVSELDVRNYGISLDDTTQYDISDLIGGDSHSETVRELTERLEKLYCGPITAQFTHIPNTEERKWFSTRYEQILKEEISDDDRIKSAKLMLKSQAFDHFMASKFGGVKRYGGEGAESCMPFYDELFKLAALNDIKDVIICTAHRGRLNLLTCLLKFPPVLMFRKMSGKAEFPPSYEGYGDVLSHLTSSVELNYASDVSTHVTMLPNASHLEAVNPVAMGKARGKEQSRSTGSYSADESRENPARPGDSVMVLQIHGDAAFTGQGIVPETLALSDLPHYTSGGSIHLILNNQIGYTTEANRGRSSMHCSDAGQVNGHPIIHVNADHPEAVIKACRVAVEYRQRFRRDVIVNFVCFRRWGHNELDEPSFTQPIMYKTIRIRSSIPDEYAASLKGRGLLETKEIESYLEDWKYTLNDNLKHVNSYEPKKTHLKGDWSNMSDPKQTISTWDTGYNIDTLRYIGSQSVNPNEVSVHSTLVKTHFDRRIKMMSTGEKLDWSTCEALAFGSLLYDGYNVRISGQDVGRGTFSQRHAMIVHQETDTPTIPLNKLKPEQTGFLEVANSPLSEEAVLGFEYGMSIENSNRLCIWEAQFGDFFNGAQIIIDTCITGGEVKWLLQSGLVMLLPHGLDGAGPEHSSCRIERFLQMTDSKETHADGDDVNLQIAYPTTPAQYYHLLRRQMVRDFRKPLLICGPKTLLRLPSCVSSIDELAPGTSFKPVIDDSTVQPDKVTKVVFVSGKHFYILDEHRMNNESLKNTAIVRVESLCPFPAEELQKIVSKYSNTTDFVWSQEEHRNQGSWNFVNTRFNNIVGTQLRYVGRDVSAIPAVGVGSIHKQQNSKLIEDTFS